MSRIRRARHQSGFVTTSNSIAQSSELSLRAKGLFLYLMSLPDNFEIRVNVLIQHSKEGRDVIHKTLKELLCAGLLERQERREENGRIAAPDYIIYDEVQPHLVEKYKQPSPSSDHQDTEKCVNTVPNPKSPDTENPHPELPDTGNPPHKNKYNKNKYYKQKQAAARASPAQEPTACEKKPHLAAAAFPEKLIGEALTAAQSTCVRQVAEAYGTQYQVQLGGKSAEALFHELCHDMQNPTSWRNCGNDFAKKLNTLKKAIRQGAWKTPTSMLQALSRKSGGETHVDTPYTGKIKTLVASFHEHLKALNGHVQAEQGLLAECPQFVTQEKEKAAQCREVLASQQQKLKQYGVWEHTRENTAPDLLRLLPPQHEQHSTEAVTSLSTTAERSSFINPIEETAVC